MEYQILYNEAALASLKRPQLQKLCAKYGLKGTGKNVEIIARLQEFGATLPPRCHLLLDDDASDEDQDIGGDMVVDEDTPTIPPPHSPHHYYHHHHHHHHHHELNPQSPSSPATTIPRPLSPPQPSYVDSKVTGYPSKRSLPIIHPRNPGNNDPPGRGKQSKDSEWEVLTEGQTSLIIHPVNIGAGKLGALDESGEIDNGTATSTASWKSARNGGRLDDCGSRKAAVIESVRRTSGSLSHKASIKRIASSLSLRPSFHRPSAPLSPPRVQATENNPPSPAPTVGVVRRHRNLGMGPSTIRLVGSQEMLGEIAGEGKTGGWEGDEILPLWGGVERAPRQEKEREEKEESMDVDALETYRQIPSIYPSLNNFHPPIPGAFPSSSSAPAFIFGSQAGGGISNEQFGEAAKAVLEGMNRKLQTKGVRGIGEAGVSARGAGMLQAGRTGENRKECGGGGRFDELHRKEFAEMDSIAAHYAAKRMPSSNNLTASASNPRPRTTTKRKASPGPSSIETASSGPSIAALEGGERAYVESPRGKRMRADEGGRGIVTAGEGAVGSKLRPWGGSKLAGGMSGNRKILGSGSETTSKSTGLNIFASSADALKRTFAALGRPSGSPRRRPPPPAAPTKPAIRKPVPPPVYKKPLPPLPSVVPALRESAAGREIGRNRAMDFEPQVARSKSTSGLRQLQEVSTASNLASGRETGSLTCKGFGRTNDHLYNLPRPPSDLDLARSLRYAKSSSHLPQPPKRDVATAAAGLRKMSRTAPPPPTFEGKVSTAPLAIPTLSLGQRMASSVLSPEASAIISRLHRPTAASLARMQPVARQMALAGNQGASVTAIDDSEAMMTKTPLTKRRYAPETPFDMAIKRHGRIGNSRS